MFHIFGSSNKRTFCVFLMKNDPIWSVSVRIVRQKHRTHFSSTLTRFLLKCWWKWSSCFLIKTNVFEFFCEHFQSQPFENHNTIYQAAGHLPEHILRIKNLQKTWKFTKFYNFVVEKNITFSPKNIKIFAKQIGKNAHFFGRQICWMSRKWLCVCDFIRFVINLTFSSS